MNHRPAFAAALLVGLLASAATAVDWKDDWMQRADIVQIRRIHDDIEASIESGAFRETRAPEGCLRDEAPVSETSTYIDRRGVVRKLFVSYGTSDSAGSVAYYYDRNGAHRFTHHKVAAVNGTSQELRVYFDRTGKELRSDLQVLEGPGYPTGIDIHVPDPRRHLDRLCGAR